MRLDRRWAALALLLPLAVAKASTSTDYAYSFPLGTPQPAEAYRVVLNPAVYASINPSADLRDMVVVNALGRPVPFGPLPATPPIKHEFKLDARLLPVPVSAVTREGVQVERSTSGGIVISQPPAGTVPQQPKEWLVDTDREISIDGIALMPESLQQDFQLRLSVEASNDLRDWRLVADDASVVRVHSDSDNVEQLSISVYDAQPARYFRLRLVGGEVDWSAGHAPAVKIAGHFSDAAADRASQLQWSPATGGANAGSDYDYTLPAALPLEAVRVELPAANAAARVHVLLQRDGNGWGEVAALDLVRAAGKGGDATAHFGPQSVQHVRLHSDTPLAQAPAVTAGCPRNSCSWPRAAARIACLPEAMPHDGVTTRWIRHWIVCAPTTAPTGCRRRLHWASALMPRARQSCRHPRCRTTGRSRCCGWCW